MDERANDEPRHPKIERDALSWLADRDESASRRGHAIDVLTRALDRLDGFEGCCQWHSESCEPPYELCCTRCSEAHHPNHADGTTCVLPHFTPLSEYGRGWRDAVDAAGLCGAYNDERPPPQYALCIKRNDHTGKHDDMWHPWGERLADAAANRLDARGHRLWVKGRATGETGQAWGGATL